MIDNSFLSKLFGCEYSFCCFLFGHLVVNLVRYKRHLSITDILLLSKVKFSMAKIFTYVAYLIAVEFGIRARSAPLPNAGTACYKFQA